MAFSYKRRISIDHTKCGSGNTSNYPFLFSSTDADFKTVGNSGKVQNSSGYDLVFYSDAALTTKLDYEVEFWSATTGQLIAWVRIPTLSSSVNTYIYLAYGDATISTFQGNVAGTWGDGGSGYFKLVDHLGDGTTLSVADSTSNANNGTNHGATATAGLIDGGGAFVAASSQYYDIADSAGLRVSNTDSIAVEFSYKTSSAGVQMIWSKRTTAASSAGLSCYMNAGQMVFILIANYPTDLISATFTTTTNDNAWHKGMWTYDGSGANSGIKLYVDGVLKTTTNSGTLSTSSSVTTHVTIGMDDSGGSATFFWNGSLDEIRYSKGIVRNVDYALSSYNNQSSPSTFYYLSPAYPLVAAITAGAGVAATFATTPAIDTTDATHLVMSGSFNNTSGSPTPSDSAGNTWILAVKSPGTETTQIWYAQKPVITSPTHTFTLTNGANQSRITVGIMAFIETTAFTSVATNSATSGASSVTTIATGAVTASSGAIVVAALGAGDSTPFDPAIDSSFIFGTYGQFATGAHVSYAAAYIVSAGGSLNPTFTWSNTFQASAAIVAFNIPVGVPTRVIMIG